MIIRKVNAGDAPVDLDREVELMMASEFGYLMNDTDRFLDYEGQEDDWRDTPEYSGGNNVKTIQNFRTS